MAQQPAAGTHGAASAAAQEELNPFKIAVEQFNLAADCLKLDDSLRQILQRPKRQLVVSIPVKMDGGEVKVFEDGSVTSLFDGAS